MAVSATLRTTGVTVAPGGAARCHVLVRNNSAVVDQFVFAVRGDVRDWTEVKPARVNLMPHQEVTVELTFTPRRTSDVLAGEHAFALQVSSREDAAGSVVQEGLVTVEPFVDVDAGLVPVTSTTRRKGRHTLAVDNHGNHVHGVEVTATDPDAKLTFKVRPHAPRLDPGTATFVKILARPKRYFWKGQNRLLPFQVKVIVPGSDPIELEAGVDQGPLIPSRFFWLFSILLAIALLLVVIVTALLRQRPVSIAGPAPTALPTPSTTAVSTTTAARTTASRTAASTTRPPAPTGGVVRRTSTAGGGGGGGGGQAVTTTFTIRTQAFPGVGGGPQLFSYVVPPGPRHRVTSVVLRNPAADVGELRVGHGDEVLAVVDLADIDRDGGDAVAFRPSQAPLLAPGESMTLAVTCGNARDACTPFGVFTAALVR
ncbi:COG1470 family protein [Actinokineospora sp. 24-640]